MNYARYFAIEKKLKTLGHPVDRQELIHNFTDGKANSLKDLNEWQYKEFCNSLEKTFNKTKEDWQNSPENRMRRKIIGLFKKMGQTKANGAIDMDYLNHWCVKYGFGKKELNSYTKTELPKLVTQVEKIYQSFLENI